MPHLIDLESDGVSGKAVLPYVLRGRYLPAGGSLCLPVSPSYCIADLTPQANPDCGSSKDQDQQ